MVWAEVGGGRTWRLTTTLSHPTARGEDGQEAGTAGTREQGKGCHQCNGTLRRTHEEEVTSHPGRKKSTNYMEENGQKMCSMIFTLIRSCFFAGPVCARSCSELKYVYQRNCNYLVP